MGACVLVCVCCVWPERCGLGLAHVFVDGGEEGSVLCGGATMDEAKRKSSETWNLTYFLDRRENLEGWKNGGVG